MRHLSAYGFGSLKVLDDEKLRALSPSIFAHQASSQTSGRYEFIPTSRVVTGLKNEGWLPVLAKETKVRKEENKDFCKHMIRFRHKDDMDKTFVNVAVNDLVSEIVLVNAHDGTSSFQLHAGIFRFVCSNGMVVADTTIQNHRIRHTGKVVDDAIEAVFEIVEETPKVFNQIEHYREISLDSEEQEILAESALSLRWPEDDRPFLPAQLLASRRRDDQHPDLWTVFNRIQENLLRGGMRGRKKNSYGRIQRTTSRAIKSVSEDLRLNKALWTLTERFAALKG